MWRAEQIFYINCYKSSIFWLLPKLHLGNGIGESYPHTSLDLARSSQYSISFLNAVRVSYRQVEKIFYALFSNKSFSHINIGEKYHFIGFENNLILVVSKKQQLLYCIREALATVASATVATVQVVLYCIVLYCIVLGVAFLFLCTLPARLIYWQNMDYEVYFNLLNQNILRGRCRNIAVTPGECQAASI